MVDIPLQFPNIGNALSQGAHAGYYVQEARQKADEEARRKAVQGDIPAAIKGDQGAYGRLIAGDPKTAVLIGDALKTMDANRRAQMKEKADFAVRGANAVLQVDPKEQPAMYARMLDEARAAGHDVSTLPQTWDASVPALLRYHRGLGVDVNKQMEEQGRNTREQLNERGRMDRHNTPQATEMPTPLGEPAPGGPAAPQPPPATGNPRISGLQPDVQTRVAALAAEYKQQTGQDLPITSGARSPQQQAALYANRGSNPYPVAAPGTSSHENGGAIDLDPRVAELLDKNGTLARFGLHRPHANDPVHVEAIPGGGAQAQAPQPQMYPQEIMQGEGGPPNSPAGDNRPSPQPGMPQPDELRTLQSYLPPGFRMMGYKGIPAYDKKGRLLVQGPNGVTTSIEIPAPSHDISSDFAAPEVQSVIQALPPITRANLNAAMRSGDHKGVANILAQAQGGVPADLYNAHGDDFRKTPYWQGVSPLDRNVVEGLLNGSIPASALSKRGGGGQGGVGGLPVNALYGLASQIDPTWSPNEGEQRKRFEASLVGNGQNAQTVAAINVVPRHAADLVRITDALNQNNPQIINSLVLQFKKQFGDTAVPDLIAARNLSALEFLKAAVGAGNLNQKLEEEFMNSIPLGSTAAQVRQVVKGYVDKVLSRADYLNETAQKYGIKDKGIIIHPETQQYVDFLEGKGATPVRGGSAAAPAAKERPPLSSFQK